MPTESRREEWREFYHQKLATRRSSGEYEEWRKQQNEYKKKYREANKVRVNEQRVRERLKIQKRTAIRRALVGPIDRRKYKTEEGRVTALRKSWKKYRDRAKTIPRLKIAREMRSYIGARLGPKRCKETSRFRELTGCSIEALLKHLEANWLPGMSWANYGFGADKWTLDHTRPCASFDLTDEDEQRAAFHWTNLKPMWYLDNVRKGDKVVMMPKADWVPRGLKQGLLPV